MGMSKQFCKMTIPRAGGWRVLCQSYRGSFASPALCSSVRMAHLVPRNLVRNKLTFTLTFYKYDSFSVLDIWILDIIFPMNSGDTQAYIKKFMQNS